MFGKQSFCIICQIDLQTVILFIYKYYIEVQIIKYHIFIPTTDYCLQSTKYYK